MTDKVANAAYADVARVAEGFPTGKTVEHTGNFYHHSQYRCRAYLGNAQNLPAGGWTKVNLDTTSWDPLASFDTANHNYKAPLGGYYLVEGRIALGNNVSVPQIAVYVNGSVVAYGVQFAANTANNLSIGEIVKVNAADLIQLYGFTSGITAMTTGTAQTAMAVHFLGGL